MGYSQRQVFLRSIFPPSLFEYSPASTMPPRQLTARRTVIPSPDPPAVHPAVTMNDWVHRKFPNRLPFVREEVLEFDATHPHLAKEFPLYFDCEYFARPGTYTREEIEAARSYTAEKQSRSYFPRELCPWFPQDSPDELLVCYNDAEVTFTIAYFLRHVLRRSR